MTAFTLRLEPALATQLDQFCREHGYKKTGLILSLLRDFLKGKKTGQAADSRKRQARNIEHLVGAVTLGGDSIKDAECYFE